MPYIVQKRTDSSYGAEYVCADYFRESERATGLVVPTYLGTTAVVASAEARPANGLLGWELVHLQQIAARPDYADHDPVLKASDLEHLVSAGVTAWSQMLDGVHPLRTKTSLVEIRSPREVVTQSGLILPAGVVMPETENADRTDEFLGYKATPDEIEAITRLEGHVQAQITGNEEPLPGNYL